MSVSFAQYVNLHPSATSFAVVVLPAPNTQVTHMRLGVTPNDGTAQSLWRLQGNELWPLDTANQ